MTSLLEDTNEMKEFGFSDLEINKYKKEQIQEMKDFGFSEEEIFKEIGMVHPNTLKNDEEVTQQNKSFWDNVKTTIGDVKERAIGERLDINWKKAMGNSLYNLALQQADKGIPYEEVIEVDEDTGFLEAGIESLTTLVADLPAYATSISGATLATGNPATGVGLGLAIPATIRSIFLDQLDKEKVQNFSQFWDNWLLQSLPEDLQKDENVLGILSASKAIGKGLEESALLIATGASTKILDVTNIPKNFFTKFATRLTAFTGLGAALEQKMPTLDDVLTNAVVFKGVGIAEKGGQMMRNRMKKTLKHPAEVTKEIFEDPIMLSEVVSKSHKTFTKEKQLDQPTITQAKKELEVLRNDKDFLDNPLANKQKIEKYKSLKKQLDDLAEPFEPIKVIKKADTKDITQSEKNFDAKIISGKVKREVDSSPYNRLIQEVSDKLHPILEVALSGKKINVKEAENIYERFRIQPGMIGRGEHTIKYGTLDYKTLKENGKGLVQIFEPIVKNEKDYNAFKRYAIAKRVIEKQSQNKKTGFDVNDAQIIVNKYNSKFEKPFREFSEYNQRLFEYMKDSGLISKEFYKTSLELNKDYVPFARELDLQLPSSKVGTFLRNPMKEFRGSEKKVYDPIETAYLNTYQFIALAEKNAVMRDFVDMAMKTKKNIEGKVKNIDDNVAKLNEKINEIDKKLQFIDVETVRKTNTTIDNLAKTKEKLTQQINVENAKKNDTFLSFGYDKVESIQKADTPTKGFKLQKKELEKLIDDPSLINEKMLEDFTIFRKQGQGLTDTQIAVRRDGKTEVYEVGLELRKAMRDVPQPIFQTALQILGLPTRVLRAGATLDPTFMARNFFRGELAATAFSKNNYLPLIHGAMGVFRLVKGKNKQTQLYKDFIKSGAMQSSLVSFDRKYIREDFMKQELTSRKVINHINPKNTLESLRAMSDFAESAARISEFRMTQKKLKKDLSKTQREILEESGFSAREVTLDFQKIGLKMQSVNAVTAFYNARFRGYEQVIKGVAKNPGKVISALVIGQTIPSVLLWFANKDSETYKNLPQWVKDTHHIVIANEGTANEIVYRIPKLWELGFIFGTLPERMLDFMAKKDPKAVEELGKELLENSGSFAFNLLPQPEVGRLPIELLANKSFFQDRPIVPRSLEGLLPEVQTTTYTSELSKLIGQGIRFIPGLNDVSSPIQIDYAIKSWTGGLGKYVLDATNAILKRAGVGDDFIEPWSDNYVKNLENMPVVRSFVVRKLSPNAQPLSDFWDSYSEVKQKLDSAKVLEKAGQFQKGQDLLTEREKALQNLSNSADTIKNFSDLIYKLQRIPKDSVDITPNEVRDNIDNLLDAMIKIANGANQFVKEVDKNID